jgi:HSF-type DNA-binding
LEPVKLTDFTTSHAVRSSKFLNKSLKYNFIGAQITFPGASRKQTSDCGQKAKGNAFWKSRSPGGGWRPTICVTIKMKMSSRLLRAESGDSSESGASHAKGHRASVHCRANQKSMDQATIHARSEHEYHDRSNVPFGPPSQISHQSASNLAFPIKLFEILDLVEKDGFSRIISWQPHGRCFVIHRPMELETFLARYMPGTNKIRSFQRQASLLAFQDSHGNTIRL